MSLTPEQRDELRRLLEAEAVEQEANGCYECARCSCQYHLRQGDEPTPFCDHCAHLFVGLLPQLLADSDALAEAQRELSALKDSDMPADLPGAVRYMIDHSNEGWSKVGKYRQWIEGIQGALADAGTVLANRTDGDYAESIRELTRERDEARRYADWKAEPAFPNWGDVQIKNTRIETAQEIREAAVRLVQNGECCGGCSSPYGKHTGFASQFDEIAVGEGFLAAADREERVKALEAKWRTELWTEREYLVACGYGGELEADMTSGEEIERRALFVQKTKLAEELSAALEPKAGEPK